SSRPRGWGRRLPAAAAAPAAGSGYVRRRMMSRRAAIGRAPILVTTFVLVLGALLWPAPVRAEPMPAETPRMAMMQFLQLARGGDDAGAAQFLELEGADERRGPELARKLKAVLDR